MPTLYNFYSRPRHTLFLPPNFQFIPESEEIPANPIIFDDIYVAQGYLNGELTVEQMLVYNIFPADWSDERIAGVRETGADPEVARAAAEAAAAMAASAPGPDTQSGPHGQDDDADESDDGAGADDEPKETRRSRK